MVKTNAEFHLRLYMLLVTFGQCQQKPGSLSKHRLNTQLFL